MLVVVVVVVVMRVHTFIHHHAGGELLQTAEIGLERAHDIADGGNTKAVGDEAK